MRHARPFFIPTAPPRMPFTGPFSMATTPPPRMWYLPPPSATDIGGTTATPL